MSDIDMKFNDDTTLESAVQQAMGAASVCWTDAPLGEFDSEQAGQVATQLIEWLREHPYTISPYAI